MLGGVADLELVLRFAPSLWLFLPPRRRQDPVGVRYDGTSSLGHVIESLGVPLPEVGRILVGNRAVPASYRPSAGDVAAVEPVARPQPLPSARFLLDVHLGGLARWLRILGLDTTYPGDVPDPVLVEQANNERRVLLTQDRRLPHRRALWLGAYVRGARPLDQLDDVVDRFAPPLTPWTRCTMCNGSLTPVPKHEVAADLPAGTRRTYDEFARCDSCGRVYWRGAHGKRITAVVESAVRTAAMRRHQTVRDEP